MTHYLKWRKTMESYSVWENLLLGLMVLGMLFWMSPGIKANIEKSRTVKPDWMGVVVPIGFVVMFVIFLVAMV
jgi:TRAP-type C4-dicarboxylate transport system permease small subunit